MLILFVTSFCFLWKLKLKYIAKDGLKSVRYLTGAFCSWAQDLSSHQILFFVFVFFPSRSLGLRVFFWFAL